MQAPNVLSLFIILEYLIWRHLSNKFRESRQETDFSAFLVRQDKEDVLSIDAMKPKDSLEAVAEILAELKQGIESEMISNLNNKG